MSAFADCPWCHAPNGAPCAPHCPYPVMVDGWPSSSDDDSYNGPPSKAERDAADEAADNRQYEWEGSDRWYRP